MGKTKEQGMKLHEGERGYGSWYFNATAKHYHGVNNFDGPMEGVGPDLGNDRRLVERHLKLLNRGRPLDVVIQDLLERESLE